jgi:tRNA-splicing ligase RtcB
MEQISKKLMSWASILATNAREQAERSASMPFVYPHVALMPDAHLGKGATVGSVIPTLKAIIPAAVGVDIGCGMAAVRLDGVRAEHLPDSLVQLRSELEHTIPVGFGVHKADKWNLNAVAPRLKALEQFVADHGHGKLGAGRKDPLSVIAFSQFGSLGGGNHFVELCIDEAGALWLMLHSGSRGIGNMIGLYFIEKAREDMRRHQVNLPDVDLAYLSEGTELFDDYVFAVGWAQDYAMGNRQEMLRRALIVLHRHLPPFKERTEIVNCHHNYVVREEHFGAEVWVTRKGAVNAEQGRFGIIPGSMGARSFIVRGKGNAESFHSCSHGAGRALSRGEAKRRFTVEDHARATEGIECRKDTGVIDETPGAYKDIDAVMAAQSDLVEVVHTLRQVLCVKG